MSEYVLEQTAEEDVATSVAEQALAKTTIRVLTMCIMWGMCGRRIEAGKLFLGKRPDPTDILLAMVAGYAAFRLTDHVIRVLRGALATGLNQPLSRWIKLGVMS